MSLLPIFIIIFCVSILKLMILSACLYLGLQTSTQCGSCMIDHHQYISLDRHIERDLRSPVLHLKIPGKSEKKMNNRAFLSRKI